MSLTNEETSSNSAPPTPPSKKPRPTVPTVLHHPNANIASYVSARSQFTQSVGSRPSVPSTAGSVLRLPATGLKALTDSVTELKTMAGTLERTVTRHEDVLIPTLTSKIEEVEDLVVQVIRDVKLLQEEHKNTLGTLTAQDEDLTALETRLQALEDATLKKARRSNEANDASVLASDGDEGGEERGEVEGHEGSKQRNNALNVSLTEWLSNCVLTHHRILSGLHSTV